jgi:glycine cleavage system H protein
VNIPDDLRYSAEHEWVRADGANAVVGISDFAQDSLGDVVFVQLPDVGTMVEAGASCAEVESTKSVSDIYSPLTGRVVEVNHALDTTPELINQDPYGEGWIFKLELADPADVANLLDAAAYQAVIDA